MKTTYHMGLDVKGVLKNWKPSQLKGLLNHPDGKSMTADEVKDVLLNELSKGHEMLPIGECDKFDYKSGCLGHPKEEDKKAA